VIVITVGQQFWSKTNFMEHRGIRYAIRMGIERGQWRVAIYPVGNGLPEERTVFGTREDAKITARSMINAWLKKRSALPPTSFR
jgi:hypothetical protein